MAHTVPVEQEQGDAPTTWHLCWQAAVGCEFFAHPSLHSKVRARLIDAHRRPGRALVDFLLLPREIHLVSRIPSGDSPGSIARAIGNVVARWVREVQSVRSPVFAAPFRAYRLESTDDLRREARMLAWRPVLLGVCRTPSHYSHGALRIALGLTPAQGFDARPLLGLFGENVQPARVAMRAWVAQRPTQRDARQWELIRGLALATVGAGPKPLLSREVRGSAAAALVAACGSEGINGALRLLETWVVAKLGMPGRMHDLRKPSSVRVRALVGCLAVANGLCSAASVACHFERSKATLSEQMKACRARAADRQILRTPIGRLIEEALALRPPTR